MNVFGCRPDTDDCVNLQSVLDAFHIGIKEEQAWAIINQCCRSLKCHSQEHFKLRPLNSPQDIYLKQDGTIHEKTWNSSNCNCADLTNVIESMGRAIYKALDYGLDEDEERQLAPALQNLIELMITCDSDKYIDDVDLLETRKHIIDHHLDEGIGSDFFSDQVDLILEHCAKHAYDNADVHEHYRNVCRALVSEALQLSQFLNQVSVGSKDVNKELSYKEPYKELDDIQVKVWARVWMQVMNQLRSGVNLKSVDIDLGSRQRREYELTPFEMLLDDINSKRYTLRKVPVELPKKVARDAQTLVLEYIRSKPPLRPASQRKLRPLSMQEPSLHERLMRDIKLEHVLKPTPPIRRKFPVLSSEGKPNLDRKKSYDDHALEMIKECECSLITCPSRRTNASANLFERFSFLNLSSRRYSSSRRPSHVSIGVEAKEDVKKASGRFKISIFGIKIFGL